MSVALRPRLFKGNAEWETQPGDAKNVYMVIFDEGFYHMRAFRLIETHLRKINLKHMMMLKLVDS